MASQKQTKKGETAASGKETKPSGGAARTSKISDRVAAYARLADRFEAEAAVMLPTTLRGQARREHVRACILEDHADRIDQQADGTNEKFDKLAGSLYSFFRGTALIFYRDMAGTDARMPTVLLLGDVHPENFGVMPNKDNVPIFSVNDFDEACYGPFSWDIKRGATGFVIAAKEEGGFGKKKRRKIARRFIQGYLDSIAHYSEYGDEARSIFRLDNSPKIIARLIDNAMKDRKGWLEARYVNEGGDGFRVSDELTPISARRDEFQDRIDQLVQTNGIEAGGRFDGFRVKDVAIRHGQGTASLGLPRYYILIEGARKDGTDDAIIEFKRARRSALHGLVPDNGFGVGGAGERIVHGQSVHLTEGDQFYGTVELEGESFLTRERAPFREDIDLDELDYSGFRHYAYACGQVLALSHARSDEVGRLDYDIEPNIVAATRPAKLFIHDMVRFAEDAFERIRRDHKFFRKDHHLGAFDAVQRTYR